MRQLSLLQRDKQSWVCNYLRGLLDTLNFSAGPSAGGAQLNSVCLHLLLSQLHYYGLLATKRSIWASGTSASWPRQGPPGSALLVLAPLGILGLLVLMLALALGF